MDEPIKQDTPTVSTQTDPITTPEPEQTSTPPETPQPPKRVRLSLRLREEEVDIEQKDGTVQTCTVREMPGPDRDSYLRWMASKAPKYENGKLVEHEDFEDHQVGLIQRCLFGPNGKKVDATLIRGYPASVQSFLFQFCQKINSIPSHLSSFLEEDKKTKKG